MEKNALVKRVTGVYSVIAVLVLSFALAFALTFTAGPSLTGSLDAYADDLAKPDRAPYVYSTGNYIGVEIYVGSAGSVDALQVYRKISSDGWEPLWDIPASDFNADNNYGWYERYDKELPKSGEYRYKYRFRRGSEYSPFSDPADAVTFLTQPVITSISSIGMKTTFKWKGDSYADSYQLNILAKDGGNWYDIATQSTTNTSITVKLDESYAGERLQYQLFPICDNPRGSPATGTIINLKKSALRSGTGTTQSRIQLCWNKVKGAQKYRIFRYDDASGKFVSIGEAGKDALSYIDKGRKPGTMYKYRIEAICTISGYTFVSGSSDTLDVYALTGNISKNAKLLKKKIRVKKAGYLYSVNSFIDHKGYYNFAYEKGKYVYIQKLNRKTLKPVKKIRIAKKYPIFGGITCDKSGNYYIFWGKTNPTEKKSVTTFAVSKYNYKGKHKGTCKGTSSYNVKSPSYSGYAMTFDGKNLVCSFGRTMYRSSDGLNHQASQVFAVNTGTMKRVEGYDNYVSHSFDQRVITLKKGGVLFADLGDAYDRGFCMQSADLEIVPFHFYGALGNNYTNSELGNIAELSSGYVLTGASGKSMKSLNGSHQLFMQLLDPETGRSLLKAKDRTGTCCGKKTTDKGVKWLTSYSDGSGVYNVKTAKISRDRLLIMWQKSKGKKSKAGTYYMIVSSSGTILKKATLLKNAELDPCEELQIVDNCAYWSAVSYTGNNKCYIISYRLKLPT